MKGSILLPERCSILADDLLIAMNKAFIRETDDDEDEGAEQAPSLPQGTRNYITPGGYARIKDELDQLLRVERPHIVAARASPFFSRWQFRRGHTRSHPEHGS